MNLSGFLKQNAIPPEDREVEISKRFLDEKGQPLKWKLHPVSETKNAEIKAACTKKVMEKGNKQRVDFNSNKYSTMLVVESVVFPDLRNAELQASYGVIGAEALISEMLISGEFANLANYAQEISGFDIEETIEEAKNS